ASFRQIARTPPHRVRAILRRKAGTASPVGSGCTQHGSETKNDPKSAAWLWFEVRQQHFMLLYGNPSGSNFLGRPPAMICLCCAAECEGHRYSGACCPSSSLVSEVLRYHQW